MNEAKVLALLQLKNLLILNKLNPLQVLILDSNSDALEKELLKTLGQSKTLNLDVLSLAGCGLTDEFLQSLSADKNSQLYQVRSLNLAANSKSITEKGLLALGEVLLHK